MTGFPAPGERSFTDTEALDPWPEPWPDPWTEPTALEGAVAPLLATERAWEPSAAAGLTSDDDEEDDDDAEDGGLANEGEDDRAGTADARWPPAPRLPRLDETVDETVDETALGAEPPFPRFPCPETPALRRTRLVDRFPAVPMVPALPAVPMDPAVACVPCVPAVPLAALAASLDWARDRILRQSRVLDFSSCALHGNPRGTLHREPLLRRRLYASRLPAIPTLRVASRQSGHASRHYLSSPRFCPPPSRFTIVPPSNTPLPRPRNPRGSAARSALPPTVRLEIVRERTSPCSCAIPSASFPSSTSSSDRRAADRSTTEPRGRNTLITEVPQKALHIRGSQQVRFRRRGVALQRRQPAGIRGKLAGVRFLDSPADPLVAGNRGFGGRDFPVDFLDKKPREIKVR